MTEEENLTLNLRVLVHNNARKNDKQLLMKELDEIDRRLKALDEINHTISISEVDEILNKYNIKR